MGGISLNKPVTLSIVGFGNRGRDAYARRIAKYTNIKIVAVCDKNPDRRREAKELLGLSDAALFTDALQFFDEPRQSDAVIIATQDKDHVAHALAALDKGYNILLEKPISPDADECKKLTDAAAEKGLEIAVCHVLRYTPFYKEIKRVIDSKQIGEIVSISAAENVAYFHQAHSFVRGNWRNSKETSPMILAKSCHDMDILLWLAGKRCKRVSSFGSTYLFRPEKAPAGAAKRCTDGCPAEADCPYSANKIYITGSEHGVATGHKGWPLTVLNFNPTEENILEAIKTGPYGRCVYHCDNDVVDHQIVNMELEDSVTINFTMCAFTEKCYREIKVMGTHGSIIADTESNIITVDRFGNGSEIIDVKALPESNEGHGGGDSGIVNAFIDSITSGKPMETSIRRSTESHIVALAAEESRLNGGKVIEV